MTTARAANDHASSPPGPLVVLAGSGFGAPRVLSQPTEHARIDALPDDPSEAAAAVRALLDVADRERRRATTVVLLGYEAAVALDPRAPRHRRDPAHGPLAWVRTYADEMPLASTSTSSDVVRAPALTVREHERARHEARVASCIESIKDGTLYQANLAHGLVVEPMTRDEALAFFLDKTRAHAPPFAAFVDDDDATLVSLSPECFLAFDLGARTVRALPIKGTRPRGRTPDLDARLVDDLLASEKDRAEHVMIVDLLRNDLSRVCAPGTVTVTSLMHVVSTTNVHHLESAIEGRLAEDVTLSRLFASTAPGGSITGAPKSTAIESIHALEGAPRGPYTGNLVVMTPDGRGAASILIRTWIRAKRGEGALHVGGGIVVDSEPGDEWQETLAKARAFGPVDDGRA